VTGSVAPFAARIIQVTGSVAPFAARIIHVSYR
jgi:hypothetical protein